MLPFIGNQQPHCLPREKNALSVSPGPSSYNLQRNSKRALFSFARAERNMSVIKKSDLLTQNVLFAAPSSSFSKNSPVAFDKAQKKECMKQHYPTLQFSTPHSYTAGTSSGFTQCDQKKSRGLKFDSVSRENRENVVFESNEHLLHSPRKSNVPYYTPKPRM